MLVVGVLCFCAAVAAGVAALWLLSRPASEDPVQKVMRSLVPTQLAAAVMLAVGGAVAVFTEPGTAMLVVIVCVIGAVGTVGAGSWQSAKSLARIGARSAESTAACGRTCATCTLSCSESESVAG
ncbi:hypothetical protein H7I53_04240 [Mycolicibacterium pulveris]|uniref:Transmembrane protein n=1 Tax=Mycolicibacterium pulveris TaxID=36813 RepID=A0A7I7UKE8_MYCPV|nr:hypothetical protein [Mycolicibacterium pulveris]MCV6979437.1 hypothetical protein [Mycolicibacterium pulveris]BBY81119.1 hypothetical protein MPUL_22770 [Mycolicibacterium pulveris]